MNQFKIIKKSNYWSTDQLCQEVEETLKQLEDAGYEIISVSMGVNLWWAPTAYITVKK
ncbi:UDP-N-acetylenolpyruvoylglucosamine reductase [Dysgonomonas sp. PH5-45]|uniref:hypothetical protein n=1 Tax=unclassified Dysgonomonas TaxID=2630389 RepID=UPI0024752989|nr:MULTISPECIES: hypothetical protein [unclassified Dysgonomonas]MDH6355216.1 UDP-N-acetylenolpyruvoylglucosamine reductase [Dysgonomonas sp. PH5-45]MDH6388161.1 UDP-N-acetylenolpyruvoylglucosamine reductase [Dysgonomonas sp. PH5-37]